MNSGWLLDRRLWIMQGSVILVFSLWIGIFGVTQVMQTNRYFSLSQDNRIRRVWIPSPRGKIYDRKGNIMVDNRPSFDVALEYEGLKEKNVAIPFLSQVLNESKQTIEQVLKSYRGPAYLSIPVKKDVDMRTLTYVEESKLQVPWVTLEVNPVRKYVLADTAASILGYVGPLDRKQYQAMKDQGYHWLDVIGKSGVEAACEAYLRGESGGMQVEVDHRGRRERIIAIKKPIPGRNVYLTIDMKFQQALEEVLKDKVGAGLIVNPNTGEILGAASRPSFDLNVFIRPDLKSELAKLFQDPQRPLINRIFQGTYGPGSIFKLIVMAAGLDTGVFKDGDWVKCEGAYRVGGSYFKCWKKSGHGQVSWKEALKYSCNVFFYYFAQRLGPENIAEYARRFGLGQVTGLDVGGEQEGLVPTLAWKKKKLKEGWFGGDTANFSIGQGFVTVTPLQMAMAVSAIANGGKLLRPYLVKKVVLPEGRTLIEMGPKIRNELNVSKNVLNQIRGAMWTVVNEPGGTGRLARLENVEVCAKTGTVQVKKGEEFKKLGWFVAYAPATNPELVLVLLIDGIKDTSGHEVAPLAHIVLEKCFQS